MNKKSNKQKQKDYALAKIKRGLIEKGGKVCCICQRVCEPDLMHVLPKSIYPEYYLKEENLVLGCRGCHDEFDNSVNFRRLQIDIYDQISKFDVKSAVKYFGMNDITE